MYKTILVTGANGLLGFELIKKLSKHHQVFKLVRSWSQELGENQIVQDLLEEIDFSKFPKKVDYIFHLAQFRDFKNFPENSNQIFKVNTVSTQTLISYGLECGLKKFIYTSTGGLYKGQSLPIPESNLIKRPEELDFYCASKFSSELLISSYSKLIDIQIIRPFFIFGPRQSDQMLIPRLIKSIMDGESIYLSGENGISINPIYVEDAASILVDLLQVPGSRLYNISGNETISISQLAVLISKILNKKPKFVYKSAEIDLIGDNSLVKEVIANIKWTQLDRSLNDTIAKKNSH